VKLSPTGYGFIPVSQVNQSVLDAFSSGTPAKQNTKSLDQFLQNDAKSFQEGRLGYTTCVFHEDVDGLVGYFTMSNESIKLSDSELMDLGLNVLTEIKFIPAVLIGKFAVRADLQGFGNGENIMELAIGQVLDVSGPSSARLAIVDAVNESKVLKFYERCGFLHCLNSLRQAKHQGVGHTVKMFVDVLA